MRRFLLVLLMPLLLLALSAAADTGTQVSTPSGLQLEFVQGLPGAREAYRLRLATKDLSAACGVYATLHGGKPQSVEDLEAWGLLPLEAMEPDGRAVPWTAVDEGTVPPASSIGVTFGAEDLRVIVMGAEGDPLSPLIQTLPYRQLTAGRPGSPLSLDQWRTVLLRDAVHLRLQASYLSFMAVPDSLESGCALFGWRAGPGFRFAVGRAAPVKQQAVEVEADPVSGVARYRLPAGPGTEPYYAWIGRASGTAVRSGAFGGWLWQTQELPRDARSPLLLGYEPPDTTPSRYVPLGRAEALPHLAPVHAPVGTWKPVTTPPQKADDLVPGGDIRPFLIKEQFTALVAERRRVNPQAPLLEPYDLAHWLLEVPEDGAGRPLPVRRRPTFDALKETHPPGLYFGQYHQDLLELSIQTTPGPVQPRGISSGGMPRTPIAPPPPGPKVDPRGVLNQLLADAGPPPPQSLLSAAVARMVANSDAWPERRLATAIEYYLTVLSFYVRQSGGTLPPDWETYRKTLRIAPAIPVSYETVVPPQPGEMALTLEVDRSRTALRMRIAPQDAPEAWLYWRVSRHPTDGRWPLVPADECQEPDLVERTYSLLLSQVIPE